MQRVQFTLRWLGNLFEIPKDFMDDNSRIQDAEAALEKNFSMRRKPSSMRSMEVA